jgi:hypothetical protein
MRSRHEGITVAWEITLVLLWLVVAALTVTAV